MIKINKPAEAPTVLRTRGEKRTRALCESYDNGQTQFSSDEFNRNIYSHKSVRQLLHSIQHGKCCYCEGYIDVKYSQVEHFRPKTHYYWLAYDWSNLLFACGDCNLAKGDSFPLKNPRSKARSHRDQITREHPLLINPAEVNPARYIGFRNERAYAIKDNPIGETTIEVLELNRREALWKKRRNQLKHLEDLLDMIDLTNGPEKRRAQQVFNELLKEYTQDSSEFTVTIRCAKKRKFFPRTI